MTAGAPQGKRHSRFALLFLPALSAGAIPLIALFFGSGNEAIEQSLDRLAAYEAAIALRPGLEAELARLKEETASLPGLVPGASAPLAAANMQNDIRGIVAQAGGEIRSSQNLPPSSADGFEKIEISYDIALPMDRLADLVYRLEVHTPYLFLDRIEFETPQNASLRSDGAPSRIEVHWIVRGYRWKG